MTRLDAACAATVKRISAYLDGELAPGECVDIERHCAACASCAAVVASLRQAVGLCREAASVPVPEHVRARARASIRRLLAGSAARFEEG